MKKSYLALCYVERNGFFPTFAPRAQSPIFVSNKFKNQNLKAQSFCFASHRLFEF